MASSPRKKGNNWEISICVNGIRKSATRRTKAECNLWALETEKDLRHGRHSGIADKTFGDLLKEYGRLVSPKKRGVDWELKRIKAICSEEIGGTKLCDLTPNSFAKWRDYRLARVGPATVLRDWNLISHALNVAVNEWQWLFDNPIKKVKRPEPPPHRERRITQVEIDALLYALGYHTDYPLTTVTARVGAAMLFAIETAMRAGEIVGLTWRHVDLDRRVAHLPKTKNGFPRDVPLSGRAIEILQHARSEEDSVFRLRSSQLDALFRKGKKRCAIEDLHFHDFRHLAITRLANSGKVSVLELARISGHRDLKMLMIYFNVSADDIALKLK